jgi:hypothetical protein
MRLQIKETTHELTALEKRNPLAGQRLRFIPGLGANLKKPLTEWQSLISYQTNCRRALVLRLRPNSHRARLHSLSLSARG